MAVAELVPACRALLELFVDKSSAATSPHAPAVPPSVSTTPVPAAPVPLLPRVPAAAPPTHVVPGLAPPVHPASPDPTASPAAPAAPAGAIPHAPGAPPPAVSVTPGPAAPVSLLPQSPAATLLTHVAPAPPPPVSAPVSPDSVPVNPPAASAPNLANLPPVPVTTTVPVSHASSVTPNPASPLAICTFPTPGPGPSPSLTPALPAPAPVTALAPPVGSAPARPSCTASAPPLADGVTPTPPPSLAPASPSAPPPIPGAAAMTHVAAAPFVPTPLQTHQSAKSIVPAVTASVQSSVLTDRAAPLGSTPALPAAAQMLPVPNPGAAWRGVSPPSELARADAPLPARSSTDARSTTSALTAVPECRDVPVSPTPALQAPASPVPGQAVGDAQPGAPPPPVPPRATAFLPQFCPVTIAAHPLNSWCSAEPHPQSAAFTDKPPPTQPSVRHTAAAAPPFSCSSVSAVKTTFPMHLPACAPPPALVPSHTAPPPATRMAPPAATMQPSPPVEALTQHPAPVQLLPPILPPVLVPLNATPQPVPTSATQSFPAPPDPQHPTGAVSKQPATVTDAMAVHITLDTNTAHAQNSPAPPASALSPSLLCPKASLQQYPSAARCPVLYMPTAPKPDPPPDLSSSALLSQPGTHIMQNRGGIDGITPPGFG
ncbi:uncharacterized protein LOC130265473 [Oenanthe melanoleuca]|uniref:uncharacterized protein LOC130265473 n=1 Tax=Oenanthe melanoleuca TaxID=2939378 RepID=UPI0024C1E340|nr:uncharacterized protein LOC130265473 [Oenanthe melanoleuca]